MYSCVAGDSLYLMQDPRFPIVKFVVAGDQQTGKTLFLNKWVGKDLDPDPEPTIGSNLIINDYTKDGITYKLQFWDTAGQEAYRSITSSYFRSAKAILLFFDVSKRDTFNSIDFWIKSVKDHTYYPSYIVIIANKIDKEMKVSEDEIKEFCKARELTYYMTSSLTGENVRDTIEDIITTLFSSSFINQEEILPILRQKKDNVNENNYCC